tara:strand:+ start:608 stop:1075 length:468 start_codon:yes stop_codon:yes gene_type:complete
MTRLSSALGTGAEFRIKKFDLAGHAFRVRVPLVIESDAMHSRIIKPDSAAIDRIYADLTKSLDEFKTLKNEELVFTENDVVVSGRSMREAATNKAMMEARITEMIRLLQPENPANTLDDITYAEIELEWPLSVQLALVEKINEVISPGYKETRGN